MVKNFTQALLRSFSPVFYDAVQPYRVTDGAQLPAAYRTGARPLHDDWTFLRSTPRISTAYRVPLPFRQDSGVSQKRWMLWDLTYPQSPGLQIEDRPVWDGVKDQILPHALVDCAIEGTGKATFSAFICGAWTPVFTSYRRRVAGYLLAMYSGGLKQDLTVSFDADYNIKSDIMGWWDPPSLSWR